VTCMRGSHAEHKARRRDDSIVGTQDGRAQPAYVLYSMLLSMSLRHLSSLIFGCLLSAGPLQSCMRDGMHWVLGTTLNGGALLLGIWAGQESGVGFNCHGWAGGLPPHGPPPRSPTIALYLHIELPFLNLRSVVAREASAEASTRVRRP
jgi:hypothetical protein